MHITAREEYGLRCALQLARAHGHGSISASQIAQLEGISVEYVSKFMHLYKKSGLVMASRGVQGGFSLIKTPQEISLNEVFEALAKGQGANKDAPASGTIGAKPNLAVPITFCDQYAGSQDACVHLNECSVRPFWQLLEYYFNQMTRELFLSDLLHKEAKSRHRIESLVLQQVNLVKQELTGRCPKSI